MIFFELTRHNFLNVALNQCVKKVTLIIHSIWCKAIICLILKDSINDTHLTVKITIELIYYPYSSLPILTIVFSSNLQTFQETIPSLFNNNRIFVQVPDKNKYSLITKCLKCKAKTAVLTTLKLSFEYMINLTNSVLQIIKNKIKADD